MATGHAPVRVALKCWKNTSAQKLNKTAYEHITTTEAPRTPQARKVKGEISVYACTRYTRTLVEVQPKFRGPRRLYEEKKKNKANLL